MMDTPKTKSWRELCTYACDREYWRARARVLHEATTDNDGCVLIFTRKYLSRNPKLRAMRSSHPEAPKELTIMFLIVDGNYYHKIGNKRAHRRTQKHSQDQEHSPTSKCEPKHENITNFITIF